MRELPQPGKQAAHSRASPRRELDRRVTWVAIFGRLLIEKTTPHIPSDFNEK
jgi:hypothetical protein